jgi:hypothetical protein
VENFSCAGQQTCTLNLNLDISSGRMVSYNRCYIKNEVIIVVWIFIQLRKLVQSPSLSLSLYIYILLIEKVAVISWELINLEWA